MRIYKIIASGLGTGYAPIAPGTAGSILGILIFYSMNLIFDHFKLDENPILVLNAVAILVCFFVGLYSIKKLNKIWVHDAPKIVIDEIVGVWIAAFALPFDWKYYFFALVLFRFFDILKPLYIRRIDKLKSSWSVQLDDVLAGIYSNIVLLLLIHFNLI
jgi:phosphatidylglycerophosphatase A